MGDGIFERYKFTFDRHHFAVLELIQRSCIHTETIEVDTFVIIGSAHIGKRAVFVSVIVRSALNIFVINVKSDFCSDFAFLRAFGKCREAIQERGDGPRFDDILDQINQILQIVLADTLNGFF